MKFEMWSIWHILYILSSLIIFTIIYFAIRNHSDKVKIIVGFVLGVLSVAILIIRNIDIFIRNGMDLEVIPLQVCHIGSLVAGFALIFKKKWLLLTSFCFNLVPAFLAMVFADSLANYDTLWAIRPQTYVWGHILIVVCALYGILVLRPKFNKYDLIKALVFVFIMCVAASYAIHYLENYLTGVLIIFIYLIIMVPHLSFCMMFYHHLFMVGLRSIGFMLLLYLPFLLLFL
ncbi:MAG: YwaF family protein [Bacilli bacterium]|nr:YwaF family protein [Bacilli bacterium]